jgi:exosortase A-associated hydrolase 2
MVNPGEEMFFFDGGGGRKLLGFLHRAVGAARDFGLVYCHPFAEEKNQSHAIVTRSARRLAQAGIAVLRFDFSGCGDSEGDLTEASADDWLAEIGRAAEVLRERTGLTKTGFWGLRAGANLAALHAASRRDPALLLLWQPLPDIKTYAYQFLRQKVATGIAAGSGGSVKEWADKLAAGEIVEVMGYPLSQRLYASLAAKSAGPAKSAYACPVGIFSFGEDAAPSGWMETMAGAMEAKNKPVPLIHVQAEPFWDRYWRYTDAAIEASAAEWARSLV